MNLCRGDCCVYMCLLDESRSQRELATNETYRGPGYPSPNWHPSQLVWIQRAIVCSPSNTMTRLLCNYLGVHEFSFLVFKTQSFRSYCLGVETQSPFSSVCPRIVLYNYCVYTFLDDKLSPSIIEKCRPFLFYFRKYNVFSCSTLPFHRPPNQNILRRLNGFRFSFTEHY